MNLPDQDTLKSLVALTALLFSIVSFLSFIFGYVGALGDGGKKEAPGPVAQAVPIPVTAADVAALLEAVAKLGDALIKAGPALWRLLASVLFLLIAALSAGVFQGSPPQPQSNIASTDKLKVDPKQNLDVNAFRSRRPETAPTGAR